MTSWQPPSWDSEADRLQYLPVSRSRDGAWEQRARYSHPDLHDELVLDLEGPLASMASDGVGVVRLVVCGDRNAGKSTLLHALSANSADRDWLRVTSLLPAVAGSFVNVRYDLSGNLAAGSAPEDEPPYIDTDLARGTVILTKEDFAFFVSDFKLEVALTQQCDYIALELLEIGGDHLDAMMSMASCRQSVPPLVKAVLEQSIESVRRVRRFAYFVNCAALFANGELDRVAWDGLVSRLAWLRSTSAEKFEALTLFASRLPREDDTPLADALTRALGQAAPHVEACLAPTLAGVHDDGDDDKRAVLDAVERDDKGTPLTRALFQYLRARQIDVAEVRPARHVFPAHAKKSAVDVPGLFSVLLSLFRRKMEETAAPTSLVVSRLFACASHFASKINETPYEPWIDATRLSDWLDVQSMRLSIDDPLPWRGIPLAQFVTAARFCCIRGWLLDHAASMTLACEGHRFALSAWPCKPDVENKNASAVAFLAPSMKHCALELRVRAPLFPPLRAVITKLVDNGLLEGPFPSALGPDLNAVAAEMDTALADALAQLRCDDDNQYATKLIWLAQDRLLLDALLAVESSTALRVSLDVSSLTDKALAALSELEQRFPPRRRDYELSEANEHKRRALERQRMVLVLEWQRAPTIQESDT